jgi:hypothetical protein
MLCLAIVDPLAKAIALDYRVPDGARNNCAEEDG